MGYLRLPLQRAVKFLVTADHQLVSGHKNTHKRSEDSLWSDLPNRFQSEGGTETTLNRAIVNANASPIHIQPLRG